MTKTSRMKKPPQIASLWAGSQLSWLEHLCIRSYQNQGHTFTLYTLDLQVEVPEGTIVRDAREIYAPTFDLSDNHRLHLVVYSDIFRLKLFQKTEAIWVDLDTCALKPIVDQSGFIFGKTESGLLQNATLRLPTNSQTLTEMLGFVKSPNPIQPWRGTRFRKGREHQISEGNTWGIQDLPWGCSGPKALSHFATQNSEIQHAASQNTYNKITGENHRRLFMPDNGYFDDPEIVSLHFFGATKKILYSMTPSGLPITNSYLESLCQKNGVNPENYPIRPVKGFFG